MDKYSKIVNLEIGKRLHLSIIAKQGDTSRYLLFNILNDGIPFNLTDKIVRTWVAKPDGTKVFSDLIIVDSINGQAEMQLTSQILAVAGNADAELVIYKNGETLSSMAFTIEVVKSLREDVIVESTNEFSALTNALTGVDNLEVNYAPRLNTKADLSYVDSKIQEVANGTPKIIALNLTELETNYPNGSEDNAVVTQNADGTNNGHIYSWGGASWLDTGILYQAVGIADKSVPPEKTTFAKSKNVFNGDYIDAVLGNVGPYTFTSSIDGISAVVKVNPNTTYNIMKSNDTDRFRLGVFPSYPQEGEQTSFIRNKDNASIQTIFTGETGNFLVVYISSETQRKTPAYLQVEEGLIISDHLQESVKISLNEQSLPKIKANMTDFAKKSKNLFDGSYLPDIFIGPDGTLAYQSGTRTTQRIPILSNTYYTVSGGNRNRFRFEDINGNLLESTNEPTALSPSNAQYMMVYYTVDGGQSEVQIEEGQSVTPYVPPYFLNRHLLGVDNEGLISFTQRSNNLFDGSYLTDTYISYNGIIATQEGTRTTNKIECKPNTYYTVSGGDRNVFRFEDSSGNLLSAVNASSALSPVDTAYMMVYYSANVEVDKVQIEEGKSATPYKPCYILNESLGVKRENIISAMPSFNITDDVRGNYTSTATQRNVTELGSDVNNLYAMYDALVTAYPDYVTKTLLGNEPTGLPIYRYDFKPPARTRGMSTTEPKVLYVSGIHGQEKWVMIEGAMFFADLAHNWQTNEVLQMLRWNVHFIVIPSLNPYGFNANQRKNGNGVDLNRNFPNGWTANADTTSTMYPGTAPLSEIESQLMDQLLSENLDIIFAIDHHNYNVYPTSAVDFLWAHSLDFRVNKALLGWANHTSMKMQKDFPTIPNAENNHLVSIIPYSPGGLHYQYFDQKGIAGAIVETVAGFEGGTEADIHQIGTDAIGNLFLSMVRYYNTL